MNYLNDDLDDGGDQLFKHVQELFFQAITNNNIVWIRSFLNGPLSSLYPKFAYSQIQIQIPFTPPHSKLTPITFAIIKSTTAIVELLFNHHKQHNIIPDQQPQLQQQEQQHQDQQDQQQPQRQFDPSTYIEHYHSLLYYALFTQNIDMVDYIISLYPSTIQSNIDSIHSQHGNPYNPLQFTTAFGPLSQVQHLIQHYKCNPLIISNKSTILHYFTAPAQSDSIEFCDYLMSLHGVQDLLEYPEPCGSTILLSLAERNKFILFKHLIERYNADLQCRDFLGHTVVHFFSKHGNIEMINYIYNIFPSLIHQSTIDDRISPLFYAAKYNQLSMVKHLIEHCNARFNRVTRDGRNLLHISLKKGSIELVDYIIGLNPSFIQSTGQYYPLFHVCKHGNVELFQHLIHHYDLNPFHVVPSGNIRYMYCSFPFEIVVNTMHFAVLSDNPGMIKAVVDVFETSHHKPVMISDAVDAGNGNFGNMNDMDNNNINKDKTHDEELQSLIPNGYPRLTGEWVNGNTTPLELAGLKLNLNAVKQLVRSKANLTSYYPIDLKSGGFSSILQSLCVNCPFKCDVIKYLLSDDCLTDWNIPLKFDDDETIAEYSTKDPIQWQISSGGSPLLFDVRDFDLMKILIERKAPVNAVDSVGSNILHYATKSHYDGCNPDECVEYLLSLPSIQEFLPQLLNQKPTLAEDDHDARIPLLSAVETCSFKTVKQLIDFKSDIQSQGTDGFQLLVYATRNPHSIIGDLLQHYPQQLQPQLFKMYPYYNTRDHYSPFHYAVKFGINKNISNSDIQTFIRYDPTLLLHQTTKNQTVLHIVVLLKRKKSSIGLKNLIEAIIENCNILL